MKQVERLELQSRVFLCTVEHKIARIARMELRRRSLNIPLSASALEMNLMYVATFL